MGAINIENLQFNVTYSDYCKYTILMVFSHYFPWYDAVCKEYL